MRMVRVANQAKPKLRYIDAFYDVLHIYVFSTVNMAAMSLIIKCFKRTRNY